MSRGLRTELWRAPIFKKEAKKEEATKEGKKNSREVGGEPGGLVCWKLRGQQGGQAAKGSRCLQRRRCGKDTKQAFGSVTSRSSELQ